MAAAAPRIPQVPEEQKVRGAKVIGRELDGIAGTTVIRRAQRGELMVKIGGEVKPVVYRTAGAYWAPREYITAWLEQHTQGLGANDTVATTG